MFDDINRSIARERAAYLRDMEYMRGNVRDSAIQEQILAFESTDSPLSKVEKEEERIDLMEAAEQIEVNDSEREEEIDRIVAMESGRMSLDEVMFDGGENPEICAAEAFEELLEGDSFMESHDY